jgi:RNA polymerase sigma factor (sigma-70 family)
MIKLTELFKTEYGRMVRFVRSQIDDAAERDAEDVVQDVMLNLFERADFIAPVENLTGYVYQSLRNRIIDLLRKRRKTDSLPDVIRDVHHDTLGEVERTEILERIFQALEFLDDKSRALIVATELEGFTFQELSEKWNVPLGTLLARKSRAMKKLREKLTGYV